MKSIVNAAIIGSSGYTGLELVKILGKHNFVQIKLITSNTYKGKPLSGLMPNTEAANLFFKATDEISEGDLEGINVIFLCLPPLESMKFVKGCLDDFNGAIIDIGSDFRIKDPREYKAWYGQEHIIKEMLESFVYGLPEINYQKIKSAKNIANPGCYPTSTLLCLAPLMALAAANNKNLKEYKNGNELEIKKSLSMCVPQNFSSTDASGAGLPHIEISDINIDSKSGVSGAGRKLKEEYLFCSINENFYAYSPLLHRHIGEIEQELKNLSGQQVRVSFTPHLLPVNRGIFTTIYCKIKLNEKLLKDCLSSPKKPGMLVKDEIPSCSCSCSQSAVTEKNMKPKSDKIRELIVSLYSWYYKKSRFVKFTGEKIPQLKDVVNTNYCNIGFAFDDRTDTLKLFSVIDNLVKGAAGQAVQNMNIMLGFDEGEGLNG